MGYLLKEALKTICGVNQWSYAVFWKIGCQNPELLIWEECYYEPITYSGLPHISGIESPELAIEDWEACWVSAEAQTSQDRVHSLVNKMKDNHVNIVGQGLVGRAAFTGNDQWILSGNYTIEAHPPEVLKELCQQFSAGMQTLAVIPVLPHGVVQLGSSLAIMENMGFVNEVKTLVCQLGCVPGALLAANYATKESPSPRTGVPISFGNLVSADLSGRSKETASATLIADSCSHQRSSPLASRLVGQSSYSSIAQVQDNLQSAVSTFQTSNMAQNFVESKVIHCQAKAIPIIKPNLQHISLLENRVTVAEVIPSNPEVWLNQEASSYIPRSGYEQPPSNDSLCASNGFMMPQQRTNGGLAFNSHKDFITAPSISNPCSFSNAQRLANNNTSCTLLVGNGCQNGDSMRTKASSSTSSFADRSTTNHLLSDSSGNGHLFVDDKGTQIELSESKERVESDLFQALGTPLTPTDEHIPGFLHGSEKHAYGYQSSRLTDAKYETSCVRPSSGDDLFDILGVDFKNKLFNGSWNNFLNNGSDTNTQSLDKTNCGSIKLQDAGSDLYSVNEGNSDSGIFSVSGSDHLLDAVVSRVHSATKQSSEDNFSCRTTLTKTNSSSVPIASPSSSRANASNQMQGEIFGLPKSLTKAGALGSCSFRSGSSKEDAGNYSQTSSIYGSQISSWVEQDNDMKRNGSVSTACSKRPDEICKSNRKRLKPGENPRPRPKDRQMIQDRVKELREIVPNGAKCSIDALLERTVKHMLFLQSVTKHADKLNQTGESKIISKEGGLLLKDNFQGGATWAYEVGSQSMVCPIIVEDLNPPRQMLVEMLCEERGLFLEIADIIRGLGLTILKGVMETRNDKIWARFAVEANRDVTRMEIFISLVRLLEQTVKSSPSSANCIDNDNMVGHQSFNQAVSIPATGRPCSLQ